MSYIFPLLLLLPLWFLLVRPQQQRLRAQQELVRSLQTGDDVITTAGIYGRITDLDDDIATVEVAPGVSLRVARPAIGRRLAPAGDSPTADAGAETGGDDRRTSRDGDGPTGGVGGPAPRAE